MNRVEKAESIILNDGVDYIVESHETPDYVQVVAVMGGDYLTYRVMNDGTVYEK